MNHRHFRIGFLAFAATAATAITAFGQPYAAWSYYKTVTVDTRTSGGAGVSTDQANFPLLVRLGAADSAVFTGAAAGGADIRFSNFDGSVALAYQIERWDAAARTAEIWALMPTVRGNSNIDNANVLRMYWGRSGQASASNGAAVFQTSNGFRGVWHLNNDFTDATGNAANTGADQGTADAAGNVARGRTFGGSASVRVADNASLNFTNAITASAWFNASSWANNNRILQKNSQPGGDDQFRIVGSSATAIRWDIPGVTLSANATATFPGTNGWHHVLATYNGSSARIYVDGVGGTARTATGTPSLSSGAFEIGHKPDGLAASDYFTGLLDEVRVQNAARDSGWARLEFQTQKIGTSFVIVGPAIQPIVNLVYQQNPATYGANAAIPNNVPAYSGTVTGFSVSPALPTGLALNTATGVISGTPTAVTAAANYTVTAANAFSSATVAVNITVAAFTAAPANLTYATPVVYGVNAAIAPNSPRFGGGAPTAYSVSPTLPAGLALSVATGVISGTPTAAAVAANYTVTASNGAGSTTAVINITVAAAPSNLTYSSNPASYAVNAAIANNTPTVTGTVTGYSVSPALPAGLSINPTTGVISGTPTVGSAAVNYTVTATNSAGSTSVTLSVAVVAAPSGYSYSTAFPVYYVGIAIDPSAPTISGVVTNYAVSPALPAGISLNPTTGVISGTPTTVTANVLYTFTASNAAGSTETYLLLRVESPSSVSPSGADAFAFRLPGGKALFLPLPASVKWVRLNILDVRGKSVWTHTAATDNNRREQTWDGSSSRGEPARAGAYLLRATLLDAGRKSLGGVEKEFSYLP